MQHQVLVEYEVSKKQLLFFLNYFICPKFQFNELGVYGSIQQRLSKIDQHIENLLNKSLERREKRKSQVHEVVNNSFHNHSEHTPKIQTQLNNGNEKKQGIELIDDFGSPSPIKKPAMEIGNDLDKAFSTVEEYASILSDSCNDVVSHDISYLDSPKEIRMRQKR